MFLEERYEPVVCLERPPGCRVANGQEEGSRNQEPAEQALQ